MSSKERLSGSRKVSAKPRRGTVVVMVDMSWMVFLVGWVVLFLFWLFFCFCFVLVRRWRWVELDRQNLLSPRGFSRGEVELGTWRWWVEKRGRSCRMHFPTTGANLLGGRPGKEKESWMCLAERSLGKMGGGGG